MATFANGKHDGKVFADLLGPKLRNGKGTVPTEQALGSKPVGLYFSAHWCPPCRGFTPKLAEWYSGGLSDVLDIVFVSSDRDQKAFDEYFGEQPWLALPFAERDLKATLSKKFKVRGIPSFVILGADGELITLNGRARVTEDGAKGSECDVSKWRDPTLKDLLFADGVELLVKDGEGKPTKVPAAKHLENKVIGLYFSAHWCPPCRGFTPKLAETYATMMSRGHVKDFEIVFASSDRDEAAFNEYYGEQPWAALVYDDRKRKSQLSDLFDVSGIPTFVIIGKDGKTITDEGRAAISADPEGLEFPWHPKPLNDIETGGGALNEKTCVVALCDGVAADVQTSVTEAMQAVAEETLGANDESPFAFFTGKNADGRLTGLLRQRLTIGSFENRVQLFILNCEDQGAYYVCDDDTAPTAASVRAFMDKFKNKGLDRKTMS